MSSDLIYREAALDFHIPTYDLNISVQDERVLGDRFEEFLKSIPAADVQPVVLCRDCRHRDPEDRKCDSGEMERQGCVFPVDDDYFCAYGER